MDSDRNLLFGVLAVQLRKVTSSQFIDFAGAWATDPSRSLTDRLVDAGLINKEDCNLILLFVEKAVAAHNGNTKETIDSFGGEEQINRILRGTVVRNVLGEVTRTSPRILGDKLDSDSISAVQETPGRYTHITEHARGGMGRVLLVQDTHLGRDVALKELLPNPVGTTEGWPPSPVRSSVPHMARFLQEARLTGQLEHPSIVPVYELGHREDGTLYYTMKLVRGKTLSAAFKGCKVLEERLKLLPHFLDLCQAISYAHSRGVIHRDIKPSNVMVGEFGATVVIDWGLAKAKGRSDTLGKDLERTIIAINLGDQALAAQTLYGHAMGTPAYMPPEQAQGLIDQIDERSDVYSLGVVLYELLTSKLPYTGKSLAEILKKVTDGPPPVIRDIEPYAPPELAAIAERAMQQDPNQRYQTSRELAEDIERFQSGALVQSYQYSRVYLLLRFVARHKSVIVTATSALFAVFMLSLFYIASLSIANNRLTESQAEI